MAWSSRPPPILYFLSSEQTEERGSPVSPGWLQLSLLTAALAPTAPHTGGKGSNRTSPDITFCGCAEGAAHHHSELKSGASDGTNMSLWAEKLARDFK